MTEHHSSAPAGTATDLDHTSFAVHDAMAWARHLRERFGATPVAGEVLTEFRYLLLYVGTVHNGATVELLDPADEGFLTRYLSKHGEGPHHLTFTVSDLPAAVASVRELGLTVLGESYDHPPWREAFIAPDSNHGVVVQLAETDRAYPGTSEILATRTREPEHYPSVSGAGDPLWWEALWDTVPGPAVALGTTHLASTDLTVSRELFHGVLGARTRAGEGWIEFTWPSGTVRVHRAEQPGVVGMSTVIGGSRTVRIGFVWLGEPG